MKSVKIYLIVASLLGLTVFTGCKKDKDKPSGNIHEAAAARLVGTYKGTIKASVGSQEYYNAIIIITKESGNKVKIAPKSGEAYSSFATKIIPIEGLQGVDDAVAQDPQGTLAYQAASKALTYVTKQTSANEMTYNFEGTKQ